MEPTERNNRPSNNEFINRGESDAILQSFKTELKRRNTHHKKSSSFKRGRRETVFGPQHLTVGSINDYCQRYRLYIGCRIGVP